MGSYEDAVDTLETELAGLQAVFDGLTDDEWKMPTKLEPLDTTSTSRSGSRTC
jgi:hypothetical protein